MGLSLLTIQGPQNESSKLQKLEPFQARQMKFLGIIKLKLKGKHHIFMGCLVRGPQKLNIFTARAIATLTFWNLYKNIKGETYEKTWKCKVGRFPLI